jgi:hypothetical protein
LKIIHTAKQPNTFQKSKIGIKVMPASQTNYCTKKLKKEAG